MASNKCRGKFSVLGAEGGRSGWIAVLTLWTYNLLSAGITKGLGIMLPTLQDQLQTQTWIIGWILTLIAVMSGLIAPFAGLLGRTFGSGYVIGACGVVITLAAIAASFIETPLQLALIYTLLSGSALGVTNILAKAAVGRSFAENYATANGIGRSGYSIGLMAFAPLVQVFLLTYGWRGTMLLIGAISLHLTACGLLNAFSGIQRPAVNYEREGYIQLHYDQPSDNDRTICPGPFGTLWKSVSNSMDFSLLANARYWAVAVITCCSVYASDVWVVYFTSQAQSNGFTLSEVGTFVTATGAGNLLAKLLQGFLTDRGLISSWTLSSLSILACSASFCASPWLTSYWPMMASSFMIMFSSGILMCQNDVIIKIVLGAEKLTGAFGWIGLKSAALIFAFGFLPGWLYDTSDSYILAFTLIGCVQAVPLVPLLVLKYCQSADKHQ